MSESLIKAPDATLDVASAHSNALTHGGLVGDVRLDRVYVKEDYGTLCFDIAFTLHADAWKKMTRTEKGEWTNTQFGKAHQYFAYEKVGTEASQSAPTIRESWNSCSQRVDQGDDTLKWVYTVEYRIPEEIRDNQDKISALQTQLSGFLSEKSASLTIPDNAPRRLYCTPN